MAKDKGNAGKIAVGALKLGWRATKAVAAVGGGDEREKCRGRITTRQSCGKRVSKKASAFGTCGNNLCIAQARLREDEQG